MAVEIERMRLLTLEELEPGTIVYDVRAGRPSMRLVVVDGGREVAGKLLLALSGDRPFQGQLIPDQGVALLPATVPRNVLIELGEEFCAVADDFARSKLSISTEGAFVAVELETSSGQPGAAYLDLSSWALVGDPGTDIRSFDQWSLIATGLGDKEWVLAQMVSRRA